jgi:hypothetical protein
MAVYFVNSRIRQAQSPQPVRPRDRADISPGAHLASGGAPVLGIANIPS